MGKVKRLRTKYHLACQKSKTTETDSASTPGVPVVRSVPGQAETPVKINDGTNIFSGVTISLSDLNQTLLPPSTPVLGSVSEVSVAGSKTEKTTKHMPKKDKRLARRKALLRRIDDIQQLRKEAKQARRRLAKKPAATNPLLMQSLIDALPVSVSAKNDQKDSSESSKEKSRHVKKAYLSKTKQSKNYLENLKHFKTVLSNDHYQAEPASAISNYLRRTVAQDSVWAGKKK